MALETTLLLDRTSTTAIVSPNARLMPRSTPPTMPLREKGRMTSVIVPHRVPPSPSAASQASRGACAMTSRLTEATTGMIMMATMSPQMKTESE